MYIEVRNAVVTLLITVLACVAVSTAGEIQSAPTVPTTTLGVKKLTETISTSSIANDRVIALQQLAAIGKPAKEALPVVVDALRDPEPHVRAMSTIAIALIAPDSKDYLAVVEQRISDNDPRVRAAACESAWKIGRSTLAINAAIKLLKERDTEVRASAAETISEMGPVAGNGAPALCELIADPDERTAIFACTALAKMGRQAFGPLSKSSHSANSRVREVSIACLSHLGILDKGLVEIFNGALDDKEWSVRTEAITGIRLLKIRDGTIAKKLVVLLDDRTKDNREEAALALGEVGDVSVLPHLEKAMNDERCQVRVAVVRALGNLGPAAIPIVEKAQRDSERPVREAAEAALKRISH